MAKAVARKLNKKTQLREDSVNRLTAAAFRLIVSKGYQACTLQEIAESAGLTKGAIFFYFENKENLLLRLLDIAEANIVDPMLAHLAENNRPAPQKIASFFRFTSKQGIDRPDELLCLIKMSIESRNSTDLADRRIIEIYQRIYQALEETVIAGKGKGELSVHLAPREFATLVVATWQGMMLEWHRLSGNIDGRVFVRTVWQTFLEGILLPPPKA